MISNAELRIFAAVNISTTDGKRAALRKIAAEVFDQYDTNDKGYITGQIRKAMLKSGQDWGEKEAVTITGTNCIRNMMPWQALVLVLRGDLMGHTTNTEATSSKYSYWQAIIENIEEGIVYRGTPSIGRISGVLDHDWSSFSHSLASEINSEYIEAFKYMQDELHPEEFDIILSGFALGDMNPEKFLDIAAANTPYSKPAVAPDTTLKSQETTSMKTFDECVSQISIQEQLSDVSLGDAGDLVLALGAALGSLDKANEVAVAAGIPEGQIEGVKAFIGGVVASGQVNENIGEHQSTAFLSEASEVVNNAFQQIVTEGQFDEQLDTSDEEAVAVAATVGADPVIDVVKGIKKEFIPALNGTFQGATEGKMSFDHFIDEVTKKLEATVKLQDEVERLRKGAAFGAAAAPVVIAASSGIPSGSEVKKKASDLFTVEGNKKLLDFEITTFEWDDPHPYVPMIDEDFYFTIENLLPTLMSLITNSPAWLAGPTGSGKSQMIMQICARLGWPLRRVNFDGEITRLDFIGRDTLRKDDSGVTVSEFVDGVLPSAMAGPYVLLCDEIDFIRPDVAAVMMPVLETGTPLVISEDGGRVVNPDPHFRIFATSNTRGNGDDSRAYQGVRTQNMALRNRFTGGFVNIDYLPKKEEEKMLRAKVPALPTKIAKQLIKLANEVRRAFVQGDIMETCSPRDLFAVGSSYCRFLSLHNDHPSAMTDAVKLHLTNKANDVDRGTMNEITQRVLG